MSKACEPSISEFFQGYPELFLTWCSFSVADYGLLVLLPLRGIDGDLRWSLPDYVVLRLPGTQTHESVLFDNESWLTCATGSDGGLRLAMSSCPLLIYIDSYSQKVCVPTKKMFQTCHAEWWN